MPPARRKRRRSLVRLSALTVGGLTLSAASLAVGLWVTLPDPAPLAKENPRTTALIEQRRREARASRRAFKQRQAWVPPEQISPAMVQAVLLSEDANFFGHEGIDFEAIREAAEHDLKVGRFARGASTLTQQLAKNLWLGTEKSLWRKAKEAVLAAKLERALSKRRILALYLNVVEMDDGVFGVEAGARHRFGTSAAALTPAQAAVLASLLPAPRSVDLDHPSTWLKTRSRRLVDRMRDHGRLDADAHRAASAELERILAGPAPGDDRDEPPVDEPRERTSAARPEPAEAPAIRTVADAPPADGLETPRGSLATGAQNGGAGTAGQEATSPKEQGGEAHE
jgi:monofunctional biosynthetic peptidoglycan transglycosylase